MFFIKVFECLLGFTYKWWKAAQRCRFSWRNDVAWWVCSNMLREADTCSSWMDAVCRQSLWQLSAAFHHRMLLFLPRLQIKWFLCHKILNFSYRCRWHVWPAATDPTPWSHSGISLWSSLSAITVTAGSLPLRPPAIWRRCSPSSPRPKLWRETSTPAISATVSEEIHSDYSFVPTSLFTL